jgi:hypothetical protein
VANQTPHEQPKADPHKADPAPVQYVVSLTPEQNEARLKRAAVEPPPPPQQMEVGGTGTAKVSFKDVHGADVKVAFATWESVGPVTVIPDDKDPTSAKLEATAPGRAQIKATTTSEAGSPAEAATEIMVIQTGTPVEGKIELSLQPAKAKAK